MKTILVMENQETQNRIKGSLGPLGFDFISYQNPVKALDNLDEIKPDLIIFSAEDFPRHWKPFLSFYRIQKSKEEGVFILLIGEEFPEEEAEKATVLEINGMIESSLDQGSLETLQDILARYNLLPEIRGDRRYPSSWMREIDFAFIHPYTYTLISGEITDISLGGLSFLPDLPQSTADILEGEEIKECSLNIEEELHSVDVKVVRNNRTMAIRYVNMPENTRRRLMEYLNHARYRED
jgi:hypothetical protein